MVYAGQAVHPGQAEIPLWARPMIGFGGFLLFWQAVVTTGWISQDYFPGVPSVVRALVGQLSDSKFWLNEGLTLVRAMGGLVLAVVTGVGIALLGARYLVVERALAPLAQLLVSLPPAALVPLSIYVFGIGATLFTFIIWFACVWTVYLSTVNALQASEPTQVHVASTLGYGSWSTVRLVRLPAALPEIVSGIRIASAGGLMAAVAAEMLAGKDGLGFMVYDTAFSLRVADMFALLVVAGMNGLLLNACVLRLRRQLVGWQDRLAATAES